MPAFAEQYQFVAAFTVFLVALAGVALVALRVDAVTARGAARAVLAGGFAAVSTAAFLQGSLLVQDAGTPGLVALRLVGVAGLLLGAVRWRGGSVSRRLLLAGAAGLAAAVPLEIAGQPVAAAGASVLGGGLVGAALLNASRRSIAARVAASAAATLLLVVLVLSVALSTVLADTVEDQAIADLDGRALQEASAIESQDRDVARDAAAVASHLVRLEVNPNDPARGRVLAQLDAAGNASEQQRELIEAEIRSLRARLYPEVAFVYVSRIGEVVASDGYEPSVLADLARSASVRETLGNRLGGRPTIEVVGDTAFAVGATPIEVQAGGVIRPLGAVIGIYPLDDRYLDGRARDGDSLALVADARILASAGAQPPAEEVARAARRVLQGRTSAVVVADERFMAARPARGAENEPLLAVVASRPTTAVDDVRESLFRTFFVIAFGGTVLALLLAAVVGDRIGGGIRRLTTAAESIQGGELGVRSGVRSRDEVGVLGATFDSMAESIEQQTDALQQAADRVEAIVAGMGEALVAIDADGHITDFNAAAEELLTVTAAEARTRPVDEVLVATTEDGGDLGARIRALEPSRWSALGTLRQRDGDAVPVALTAGPLHGPDGGITGGVVVLRDLRAEQEVERMKRHFLSRVGHELRTPLTPLIGFSRLLAGRPLPPERAKDVYESILTSAQRLERIVEMLEFFASLDAGRDVVHPEPLDLRAMLSEVVDRRAASIGHPHRLTKRISRETPPVKADSRWLSRAVDELIDNAVKFSPSGGRISVTAGPAPGDPHTVEIAVRDPGVGMSDEEMRQAFTEWAQGDESDTRPVGGLGLGLALVHRVAERHGGRVACETAPGRGSKFSILLPAAAGGENGAVPRTRRRARSEGGEAADEQPAESPT